MFVFPEWRYLNLPSIKFDHQKSCLSMFFHQIKITQITVLEWAAIFEVARFSLVLKLLKPFSKSLSLIFIGFAFVWIWQIMYNFKGNEFYCDGGHLKSTYMHILVRNLPCGPPPPPPKSLGIAHDFTARRVVSIMCSVVPDPACSAAGMPVFRQKPEFQALGSYKFRLICTVLHTNKVSRLHFQALNLQVTGIPECSHCLLETRSLANNETPLPLYAYHTHRCETPPPPFVRTYFVDGL